MTVYIIILLITTGCALYYDIENHNNAKQVWMIIIFILLTIMLGVRFQVGGDTINYMGDYQWRVPLSEWKLNLIDIYQPGYTLICALGKSISPEFYVFQIIHAIIVNTLLFIFLNKHTKYFFSALIGVFISCYLYFTTEVLREVIAVLIFNLNYKNYKQGNWLKYYIGVLLSICFHISAIFLIILPLFRKLKFNKKYTIILVITILGSFFSRGLLLSLASLPIFMNKITGYIDATSTGFLSDFMNICRYFILPLFFSLIVKYGARKKIQFESMVALLSLIGVASFFNYIIFGRLTNYFILFFVVSITNSTILLIKSYNRILNQYGLVLTLSFFLLFSSDLFMYKKYTRWIPYYSIFHPIEVNRDNYN